MFGIDGGEFVVLALVALFLLGPERLPGLAKQAARALHDVRRWAERTREDIGRELGPEFENFDLADLNPKKFVQKHLLDPLEDDDEDLPARTYGSSVLATRTADPAITGPASAVSLEKPLALESASGGSTAFAPRTRRGGTLHDLAHVGAGTLDADTRLGPDLTTDVFADPVRDRSLPEVPGELEDPPDAEVPAWGDTASARERADTPEAAPDEVEDEAAAWSMSFYVAPPIDLDAT